MTLARVFFPFAFGYFLSYLLRVVNAVIAPDLSDELSLSAADLGLLTSANFLAFAAFQLPLGILLDRYGPRRTESVLLIVAASGAFLFAIADGLNALIIGRAMIGLGTSACLMAAFKAYVMWVDKKRIPFINGCQMAAGGLGALTGTVPVEIALQTTDWRGVMFILAALSLTAAVVLFFVVPKRRDEETSSEPLGPQLRAIRDIFVHPAFWRIVPLCVSSQCAFLSIQSLWSGPWLSDVAGLSRSSVADHLFLIACAMVAGFLGMGVITDRLARFGISTMSVAITGMSLFALAQIGLALQLLDFTLPLWLLFGFFGTTGILPYAALPQRFPVNLTGRVITGLNVLVFFSAFAAQWGIGVIINQWERTASGGYDPAGYQVAFALIVGIQITGLIWYALFRRE
jgi:predicted MFS family arabinose efflux permease